MLCPITNQFEVELTAVRQDDGGQPEEVEVVAIKYIDSVVVEPAAYDKRNDNTMTFTLNDDGVYLILFTGGVSGLMQNENLIADYNAKAIISNVGKKDVENMLCGKCSCSNYKQLKALLPSADTIETCKDIKNAHDALNLIAIINAGCGPAQCSCGC